VPVNKLPFEELKHTSLPYLITLTGFLIEPLITKRVGALFEPPAVFTEGRREVCIDSTLEEGYLTRRVLPSGESEDEVLISCHACHPSLCNDNLSGIALATFWQNI